MNKKNKFNGLQSHQQQQQQQQKQQLSKMRADNFGSNATGIYDGYPNNNVLSTNSTSLSSLTPLQSQALVPFGGNNNAITNYNGSGNGNVNCYSNTSSTNLQLSPTNNVDTKMYQLQPPPLYTQQNQNSSNISGSGMYSYGDPAGTSYNNTNRNQSLLNSKNQSASRKNGLDSAPSAFMSIVPFSQQKQQQQQDQQHRYMIDMKPNSTNSTNNNGRSEWLKNQSTSLSSNNNWISNYSQQNNVPPINTQLPSQYQYFPQMIGDSIYNNNNNYQLPTFTNSNMLNSCGTIPNLMSSYGGSGNGMNSVNFPTMQNMTGYNMMPTAQTNSNGYIFGQNNSQQYLPSSLQQQQQNIPIVMGGMPTTNGNTTGMMGFNNNNNYPQFSGYGGTIGGSGSIGYGTAGGAMYPASSSSYPVMNGSYNGYEMMKGYQNNSNNPMMRSNNGLRTSRSFYDMSNNFCGGNGIGSSFGGGGGFSSSGVSPNYRTMNHSGMEVLCSNGNGISMNLPLVPQGYIPDFINDLQYYGNLNDCQVYPGPF